jgi:hypothetical protein
MKISSQKTYVKRRWTAENEDGDEILVLTREDVPEKCAIYKFSQGESTVTVDVFDEEMAEAAVLLLRAALAMKEQA